ncbi:MAG TPA: hypothetical protein VF748_12145 [Candidatus Acidoferrum sp.]
MANEIAKQEPNYFEKYGEAATQRAIVGRLLKFTKFGEYVAGQDNMAVPIGTSLVAYMPSLAVGYVRWENSRPVDYQMGYVREGFVPPNRNDLEFNNMAQWEVDNTGRPRDPWQFTNSLIFIDLVDAKAFTFNTSSKGGLGAVGNLSKIYGRHVKTAPDDLPLIKLGVDSYRHFKREYGEIRVPVFEVEGWTPKDSLPYIEGLPSPDDDPPPPAEEVLLDDRVPF